MKRLLAALLICATPAVAAPPKPVLYLYNWSEYMPDEVLDMFEKQSGITVKYTTYDSNESMYAKLRLLDASNSYDLVVPSTYYVSKMMKEGLLLEMDKSRLPGLDALDGRLTRQPFDPDNRFSVPYLWGTTGLAINRDASPESIARWSDLWKPEFEGRVMMTNDMREVFHVGLRVLGYSGNTTDPAQIEAAYRKLLTLQPSVRTYNSDAPRMPFIEGETDVGMMWNGEAHQTLTDLPDLQYVYPLEGAVIWMDNFVIPRNARNPDAAHQFIAFVLRPEIAQKISEDIGYATPNREAMKLMNKATRENRTIYPNDEDLRNAEFHVDVGDAITVYESYWEKLKAAHGSE